jgi:hypothetical protein
MFRIVIIILIYYRHRPIYLSDESLLVVLFTVQIPCIVLSDSWRPVHDTV